MQGGYTRYRLGLFGLVVVAWVRLGKKWILYARRKPCHPVRESRDICVILLGMGVTAGTLMTLEKAKANWSSMRWKG